MALAVAALAGCAPDDRPGPRGLLRVDAPVLVAMDGAPVADGAPARVAAPRDAGARLVGRVAAGVGAMAVTPGARMLAAPLAVLDAAPADADCPARDDALREADEDLRAALRPVAHAATEAMRVGVER
ncbi:MAG TPA: hypothetical protein PKC20_14060, partial [Burkholderiaceae bacterium]|nr:hypothetical protein [Burkholderiaceae bacterium]